MLGHLMTWLSLRFLGSKTWISQEQKELLKWNKKLFPEKQNRENISEMTFQIFDIKRKCDGENF